MLSKLFLHAVLPVTNSEFSQARRCDECIMGINENSEGNPDPVPELHQYNCEGINSDNEISQFDDAEDDISLTGEGMACAEVLWDDQFVNVAFGQEEKMHTSSLTDEVEMSQFSNAEDDDDESEKS